MQVEIQRRRRWLVRYGVHTPFGIRQFQNVERFSRALLDTRLHRISVWLLGHPAKHNSRRRLCVRRSSLRCRASCLAVARRRRKGFANTPRRLRVLRRIAEEHRFAGFTHVTEMVHRAIETRSTNPQARTNGSSLCLCVFVVKNRVRWSRTSDLLTAEIARSAEAGFSRNASASHLRHATSASWDEQLRKTALLASLTVCLRRHARCAVGVHRAPSARAGRESPGWPGSPQSRRSR
jgi:hypothetical protein